MYLSQNIGYSLYGEQGGGGEAEKKNYRKFKRQLTFKQSYVIWEETKNIYNITGIWELRT